jgi:hypothetical protein
VPDHLIHGDVAGAEPVDDWEGVVSVEANTTLLSSNSLQPNLDALYESVT